MLKIAWSKEYHHPLPEGHRFPMDKYSLIPEQLIYEGTATEKNFFKPAPIDLDHVLAVHDRAYVKKLQTLKLTKQEERKTGFPLSRALVEREFLITQGTIECTAYAMEFGCAMNVAGGTHHAYADHGEGFCLLNDIAVSASYLLRSGQSKKILVVDLDVHQGNGTAKIFQGEDRVFTFSMHGAKNYPAKKEVSDLDIALPDYTGDEVYLDTLRQHLPQLINSQKPDFIFFQSGVDIIEGDKLGRLSVSKQGCKERDSIVFNLAKKHQIPIVAVMGGGYAPRVSDIVEAHANTYRLAQEIFY